MEPIAALARELGGIVADLPHWAEASAILGLFALAALVVHALAVHAIRATVGRRLGDMGRGILARVRGPTRIGLVLLLVGGALPAVPLEPAARGWIGYLILLAFIVVIGWAAMVVVDVAAEVYLDRLPPEADDASLARKAMTQVRLLRRIAVILIGVLTVAGLMTTSPVARQYGTSLFASAGVAGLVIGLAAQPVLSNIIAGLQIAITQPMRLEDAVVVEGEFGFVEDIHTSYVVVRTWDLRRLIVPLKRFIEQTFQNWTREQPQIIGSVHLYLDYTAPIAEIRARFESLVRASPLFDGDVVGMQVTDADRETITVRGIMSAPSPVAAWELRCAVREALVAWLQEAHPRALPQVRTRTLAGPGEAAAAAAETGGETGEPG